MKRAKIIIVRHGESEANQRNDKNPHDRLFGGDNNYSLTEFGRQQAESLKEMFRSTGIQFNRILCSPLKRAQETATIISNGMLKIETVDALVERRLGKISGHTSSEVRKIFPELHVHLEICPELSHLRESFTTYPDTGVESYAQVLERLQEGLPLPDPGSDERYLVVGHKHTNRALLHLLLRRGKTDEPVTTSLKLPNAHPIELEMHNGHWRHISGLEPWPYDVHSHTHVGSHDVRGMHSSGSLKNLRRASP